MEVSSDHSHLRFTYFAGSHQCDHHWNGVLSFKWKSLVIILISGSRILLEVISVRAINSIPLYASRMKAIRWISVLISVA